MTREIVNQMLRAPYALSLLSAITGLCIVIAPMLPDSAWGAPSSLYELPYILTNNQTGVLQLSEWRGKPIILTMEYSGCRFMCTTTFTQLKEL